MRALSMNYSVTIDAPLDQALTWCLSRESRRNWPGVTWVAMQGPATLTYEVDIAHWDDPKINRLIAMGERNPHRHHALNARGWHCLNSRMHMVAAPHRQGRQGRDHHRRGTSPCPRAGRERAHRVRDGPALVLADG